MKLLASVTKRIRARRHAVSKIPSLIRSMAWLSPARILFVAISSACLGANVYAQSTGTVEGRVVNPVSGEYLERARITVEGTRLETFTDADGSYRLTNVPAGVVSVQAFFTGFTPETNKVTVTAGQTLRQDIRLLPFNKQPGAAFDSSIVVLDAVAVNESREMTATAYAINEQRFAPSIKNVVSTDEFGTVAEGNLGEFLKFLPGISIDYASGFAAGVSINGVPADNVPITVDGFSVADAGLGGSTGTSTGRAVQLTSVSLNNVSRIEVVYSPTPESKGSALAGSVNMVPRSSFERVRPVFNFSTYIMMRDDRRQIKKTPGPLRDPSRKIYPSFDFSYVRPVNKRFGFTLSGSHSKQYSAEPLSEMTWRGVAAATNGAVYPDTTPDQPYLTSYRFRDGGRENPRTSFGATVDYKVAENDRLSFSFQYTYNHMFSTNHTLSFEVGRVLPGDFSATSTRGAAGAGTLTSSSFGRDMGNRVYTPSLRWRHDGPIWTAEAGAGLSHSRSRDRNIDKGMFQGTTSRRTGVTVSFDDIFYLRPGIITVTDGTTGVPVDPYDLDNYALISGAASQTDSNVRRRNAFASLSREFTWHVPFRLKGGLDIEESMRDLRRINPTFNYLGKDGRGSTTPVGTDDGAGPFVDPTVVNVSGPWGFPGMPRPSPWLIYEHSRDNPTWFTVNENTAYRNEVNGSKLAEETISSAYIRGDISFLDNRLKVVTGVRAEQTNINAEGPLTDPTRNIQRDASGKPILGANGQPLPITTNALETSRLTLIERGTRVDKEYLRFFPSLNASYAIRDNLIVRGAYYYSVGRPNFNQYAGGITLPNLENPPSSSNRITVNNAGIKAWSAKSAQLRLEYYFQGVGQISIGGFRRDIENFFGGVVMPATPQFLALYGLDPDDYGEYSVSTQHNLQGIVRMEGVNMNYKQALTFLPRWARGVQIFANTSAQRATGAATNNFAGLVPRTASWGISLTREKYNLRMNWNYRGRNRRGLVAAGSSIEPGTYNWGSKYLFLDVVGEYHFRKNLSFYFNLRNLTDSPEDFKIAGPSTPKYAQFRSRIDYASLWTFGLKGSF